jgi:acyl-CoA thioester hydrolase
MKPEQIPGEQISLLRPVCLRRTIPTEYLDLNHHMNMRWYVALFDDAGDTLHDHLGLTREFRQASGTGTMDLEHHTWFINEVMAGSQIGVYARMVARSAKMIHYLMFMVNESTGKVAAHFECVNALVDLRARKTAPYPAEILARIDAMLAEQSRLAWAPPISGAMRVAIA